MNGYCSDILDTIMFPLLFLVAVVIWALDEQKQRNIAGMRDKEDGNLLGVGVRDGDCRKGYCTECMREHPGQEELWHVNWIGEFYCQKHLEEIIELD